MVSMCILKKKYWLVVYLPLWKMMEFVSWDDYFPNWLENNIQIHVPNHQPDDWRSENKTQ